VLVFGTFEFDLRSGELRKRGLRIKLQPKPSAVLAALVNSPGNVVTLAQLRDEVWPSNTFVDFEHSLGIAIWKLRSVLGDSAKNPRFIETLPRRGYRFLAPVRELSANGRAAGKKMLAVIPFDDLGKPACDDYFADGLTEELITQIGRLNPHRLGAIARTSMLRYKSTSKRLDEIATELGVGHLLTGTIRRYGARVRVTAQLNQASDQSPVWTGSYDRLSTDILDVQIELAEQIASSLAIELLPEQEERIARIRTHSPEAHEFYLQGRFNWNKRTPAGTFTGLEYFKKAVVADPNHAPSYVGLADCFAVIGFYGDLPPAEAFGKSKEYARKALELDDSLAEAHSALAFCLLEYDWDWSAAEHEHLRAIQLNPNCAPAHHWYGITLIQIGAFPEALRSLRRALELDPFDVAVHAMVGRLSYFSHDFDRALIELRHALDLDGSYLPGIYFHALAMLQSGDEKNAIVQLQDLVRVLKEHPIAVSALAYAYGKAGRHAAANRALNQLHALAQSSRVSPYFLAFAEAGLERTEQVFTYLEQAFVERFGWLFYLKMDPVFNFLRMDSRFNDLVHRIDPTTGIAGRSAASGK